MVTFFSLWAVAIEADPPASARTRKKNVARIVGVFVIAYSSGKSCLRHCHRKSRHIVSLIGLADRVIRIHRDSNQ
jgi:hypothetical protein